MADQKDSQLLHFLHYFAGGKATTGGHPTVMITDSLPGGPGFPAKRPQHLEQGVDDQAELPLHQRPGKGASSAALIKPVGPLPYHLITYLLYCMGCNQQSLM